MRLSDLDRLGPRGSGGARARARSRDKVGLAASAPRRDQSPARDMIDRIAVSSRVRAASHSPWARFKKCPADRHILRFTALRPEEAGEICYKSAMDRDILQKHLFDLKLRIRRTTRLVAEQREMIERIDRCGRDSTSARGTLDGLMELLKLLQLQRVRVLSELEAPKRWVGRPAGALRLRGIS
jgi:hypothetical protein